MKQNNDKNFERFMSHPLGISCLDLRFDDGKAKAPLWRHRCRHRTRWAFWTPDDARWIEKALQTREIWASEHLKMQDQQVKHLYVSCISSLSASKTSSTICRRSEVVTVSMSGLPGSHMESQPKGGQKRLEILAATCRNPFAQKEKIRASISQF